ncbi:MAG: hypothetical protein JSS66_00240 [Armatimonadetes bacterium]|nr:hypothetical protein [Armatimonadota bacterium]
MSRPGHKKYIPGQSIPSTAEKVYEPMTPEKWARLRQLIQEFKIPDWWHEIGATEEQKVEEPDEKAERIYGWDD